MKKKYIIVSDTHFNHTKLITNNIRPENFDEIIIKNLYTLVKSKTITANDVLIHLGDVSWDGKINSSFLALPCKKILVRGNHDKQSNFWYMEHGFDFSCDSFSIKRDNTDIIFTHKPLPFSKLNSTDFNIHGHLHDFFHKEEFTWLENSKNHYLISLERNNYKPELLDIILSKRGT